jgi:hypothetical protein
VRRAVERQHATPWHTISFLRVEGAVNIKAKFSAADHRDYVLGIVSICPQDAPPEFIVAAAQVDQ